GRPPSRRASMPDTIVDSKFRLLETLPKLAGRQRHLASDLISSQVAVLEFVPLEGMERVADRWSEHWQPALRERVARFASQPSFVPVIAVGAWNDGLYYVYACDDPQVLQGSAPERVPPLAAVRHLLGDLARSN